jgi:hypothetical protein
MLFTIAPRFLDTTPRKFLVQWRLENKQYLSDTEVDIIMCIGLKRKSLRQSSRGLTGRQFPRK